MKKKFIIVGVMVVSSLLLGSFYNLFMNKNEMKKVISNKEKRLENPLEILGSDNLAFTVNGESTKLSYDELMSSKVINKIICENGTKAEWNNSNNSIALSEIHMPDYCTIDFVDIVKTLYEKILEDKTTRPGGNRPGAFKEIYTADNIKTLYETTKTENGKTSYYFAGNATDNWVYFAELYWRIIRINEDNSVRLLYVGPDKVTTTGYIDEKTYMYSTANNSPRYVGYMLGSSAGSLANDRGNQANSNIKGKIDNWYITNMTEKNDETNTYDSYVSRTAIYCNDRSISSGTYNSLNELVYFGARGRLDSAKTPSYKCGQNANAGLYESSQSLADKFSGSTTEGGNGKLSNAPVALMTADEVVFVGGVFVKNSQAWYYYNAAGESVVGNGNWWTMSPYQGGSTSTMFYVCGSGLLGRLGSAPVNNSLGVRPVLSLKSCVQYSSGDGSSDFPYTVSIDNTCVDALN